MFFLYGKPVMNGHNGHQSNLSTLLDQFSNSRWMADLVELEENGQLVFLIKGGWDLKTMGNQWETIGNPMGTNRATNILFVPEGC
jgi:hypothetical protein